MWRSAAGKPWVGRSGDVAVAAGNSYTGDDGALVLQGGYSEFGNGGDVIMDAGDSGTGDSTKEGLIRIAPPAPHLCASAAVGQRLCARTCLAT